MSAFYQRGRKPGLTWKERRLEVVGGRLRRRVEPVQRE